MKVSTCSLKRHSFSSTPSSPKGGEKKDFSVRAIEKKSATESERRSEAIEKDKSANSHSCADREKQDVLKACLLLALQSSGKASPRKAKGEFKSARFLQVLQKQGLDERGCSCSAKKSSPQATKERREKTKEEKEFWKRFEASVLLRNAMPQVQWNIDSGEDDA